MAYRTLTSAQVEQFLDKGYIKIEGAFPRELAEEHVRECFERLGYEMDDKSTWAEARIHMGGDKRWNVKDIAPKVYDAICDLLGGEDRVVQPVTWSDHYIVNLGIGADEPWQAASPETPGWHKDGDFFRHFLDSPEQGLLVFVNWTDVEHQGGPTYIATDSIKVLAQFLADRPEGVMPGAFGFQDLIAQCKDFEEATGKAGDVFLLHPFTLHASSQNNRRLIRVITNPPVALKEPMCFDGVNPSLVEQVVLNALDVDHLDFVPTSERERIVPDRVKQQMAREAAAKAQASEA
ncbi:phytanoyl-CoA dioxygenase family protein [soil metagenome]